MMLLFDQNISHRLVSNLNSNLGKCSQVRSLGLENATDMMIWEYAKKNNYTIVTFDTDFYDISTLKGHPPKIIWMRTGNTSTKNLESILLKHKAIIESFINSDDYKEVSCLEIE